MTEVIKADVVWQACFEDEDAMLAAYKDGDLMEMGRMVQKRIAYNAALRIRLREEEKAKYRAEILAEVCGGGEA